MRYKIALIYLLGFYITPKMQAKRITALRINEIFVINKENFADDYGNRFPWIGIYNFSPRTVDIAGCFLTNNINEPKKYMVPKGNMLAKIKSSQHILFLAENVFMHGIFHLNFTLNPDEVNSIVLFDSDGKTLIDSISVPTGQRLDANYGLVRNSWDKKYLAEEIKLNSSPGRGENKLWIYHKELIPSFNSKVLNTNGEIESFKKNDSSGVGMTLTAMFVVFCGLVVLYLIFKFVGRIAIFLSTRRTIQASGITKEELMKIIQPSGEIFAAIAMAIYEATEMHDEENAIITIKNTARNYSPWSSKIYMLRETPNKK